MGEKASLRVELDPKMHYELKVESARRRVKLTVLLRTLLAAWLKRDPRALEIIRESQAEQ